MSTLQECYDNIILWMKSLSVLSLIVDNKKCDFTTNIPDGTLDTNTYTNCKNFGMLYITWGSIPTTDINKNDVNMYMSVFKNELVGFYIEVVHDITNSNIYMIVTDDYKYNMPWNRQENSSELSESLANISDFTDLYFASGQNDGIIFNYNNLYSCPVAKIKIESNNTELYCNYSDNNIEISTVDATDVTRHTYNMFCGVIKKHRYWDKGWFYGGSSCGVIQMINRISVNRRSKKTSVGTTVSYGVLSFLGTDTVYIDDPEHCNFDYHIRKYKNSPNRDYKTYIVYPISDGQYYIYNNSKPNIRFNNNFDCFVRIEVDCSVERNKYWASTINNSKFTKMYCSYSNDSIELPTYKNLISHSALDTGSTVNTLNGISLCMPIYFEVLRDPNILDNYSSIGYADFINYVSMYNLSSGSTNKISYPTSLEEEYNCFSLYKRRMSNQYLNKNWYENYKDGFSGYAGIAVRNGYKETIISDWYYMKSININKKELRTIYNSSTKIKAFNGTTNYTSKYKNGVMYLKVQYNYFDKIKIKYTDLSGTFSKEVEWDSLELKKKLDGIDTFDLLKATDTDYHWNITPLKGELDQQIEWYSNDNNCAIIDIIGI